MSNKMILEQIERLYPKYVKVWEDICNIESPTRNKAAVDAVGEYFINMAKDFGWKVEVFEQPVSGNPVCITLNPDSKEQPVSLSAHMDTVHEIGAFGSPAVRIENGMIYGPGTDDCKGGLAVSMLVMEALESCGYKKRPIQFLLQSDEEVGSELSNKATINWICDKSENAAAFFNLEGSSKGKVCIARKGITSFDFIIHGKEGHSSVCAKEGANAILDAAYKIIEIEKIKDHQGLTCCTSIINGGTKHNIIPGECRFHVNVRYATKAQYDEITEFMNKLAATEHVPGCTCELIHKRGRPSMERTDVNVKLLERMNEILRENGMDELGEVFGHGGTDAAYATQRGIPTIDSVGTRGSGIHSIKEHSELASLKDMAEILATVIYSL